jgi:hypothetical protein
MPLDGIVGVGVDLEVLVLVWLVFVVSGGRVEWWWKIFIPDPYFPRMSRLSKQHLESTE